MAIGTIFLVIADLCFLVGSVSWGAPPAGPFYGRINWISFGLFLWLLSILIGGVRLR